MKIELHGLSVPAETRGESYCFLKKSANPPDWSGVSNAFELLTQCLVRCRTV